MASGDKLNIDGLTTGATSYLFGSGKRSYNKYLGIDPLDTGTGGKATIYTGDAMAVRVAVSDLADANNTVRLFAGEGVSQSAISFKVAIGADIAAPTISWITTDIPEFLEVERVTSNGAAVSVLVDVYFGPNNR